MAVHSISYNFFANLAQEIETEASISLSPIQNYASEYTLFADPQHCYHHAPTVNQRLLLQLLIS
jgi:hypothetical protein